MLGKPLNPWRPHILGTRPPFGGSWQVQWHSPEKYLANYQTKSLDAFLVGSWPHYGRRAAQQLCTRVSAKVGLVVNA